MQRLEPGASTIPPPPDVPGADLDAYVPAPLRAHLAVSSGEAEHRQVTVAFLKLSGTDELIAAEGPGRAARADRRARRAVAAQACETYGLTWLESDIDVGAVKLYLTGGAPSSSGEDEEGMLRALREIVAADVGLPLRAGVNRGHVFTGDIGGATRRTYAVMGDAVNLAARLTARAQPGDILATADVLDRAKTIYATDREPLLVKGKERAVTAHHVGDAVGLARRGRGRHDADRRPRARSSTSSAQRSTRARMRQLAVVELVGEPGIGKSRLVRELRTLALGFAQLTRAAEQYASSTPFFAWRNLLRQLAGITPDRSREEAGAQLAPWVTAAMPDLAPWLPLLAIPFDAERALDAGGRRPRPGREPRPAPRDRRDVPRARADDADAARLSRTRTGSTTRRASCSATSPRSRPRGPGSSASRRGPAREPIVNLDGPADAHRAAAARDRATRRRSRSASRTSSRSRPRRVDALAERSGGNPLFVRELVFAARARRALRDAPGVGREPAHDAHRHARARRPDAAPLRGGRRPVVRARLPRRDPRGRDPGRRRPGALGAARASSSATQATGRSRSATTSSARPPTRASRSAAAARSTAASRRRSSSARASASTRRRRCSRSTSSRRASTSRRGATPSSAAERAQATFANVVAAELYERAIAAAEHAAGALRRRDRARARGARRRLRALRRVRPRVRRARDGARPRGRASRRSSTRACSASRRGARARRPLRRGARRVRRGASRGSTTPADGRRASTRSGPRSS